jgi:hypothetical protein
MVEKSYNVRAIVDDEQLEELHIQVVKKDEE